MNSYFDDEEFEEFIDSNKPTKKVRDGFSWSASLRAYAIAFAQFCVFVFGSLIFMTMTAFVLQQLELGISFFLILLIILFLQKVISSANKFPWIEKIPIGGDAIMAVAELQRYYQGNKSKIFPVFLMIIIANIVAESILSYDLDMYLTGALLLFLCFFRKLHEELFLYAKIFMPLLILIVIESFLSLVGVSHVNLGEILLAVFATFALLLPIFLIYTMPIFCVSFDLLADNKVWRLRIFTILALLVSLPFLIYLFCIQFEVIEDGYVTGLSSYHVLKFRLQKEDFREELEETTKVFLYYYTNKNLGNNDQDNLYSSELTQKFHLWSAGVLPNGQNYSFRVIHFRIGSQKLLGITYGINEKESNLLWLQSRTQFYRSWKQLPYMIRKKISDSKMISQGMMIEELKDSDKMNFSFWDPYK